MPPLDTFNRFLARQPILTRDRKFFAYEILSRYGPENYCRPAPNSPISVNAMDELFLMGVRTMTEGLPAFLNCTREFLMLRYLNSPVFGFTSEIYSIPHALTLLGELPLRKWISLVSEIHLRIDWFEDRNAS